ncbi:aldehyde dehydrogenase family protein [Desulfosporosinus sp. BICA1-9]|uniref:aldehyde dehydrogenase family protein n=1 Tax=Desulfosporosinus sp. BICA1-9 TaxID=1531958 RepID=UPI00054B6015|nr:aldehyde dehydrogenase family protein [Desulfosporosinus sp. BICA1-9]KJS46162.1 MAG: aldehyde dehydrogenase [Peptococcaceae bacterium BRH_c23]KJS90073.1 MAG: aldehyde dehydrogenase [Desulfosporosinus sp. BICA1-9]HBW36311.1 aldehyde dehydrogenase [Desulfosporosinus sp.]
MALIPEVKKYYGRHKLFINGEWIDSKSTDVEVNRNPATGEIISELPNATKEEALAAVKAAHEAFKLWKEVPMRDKARLLFDLRAKLEERSDVLAKVLSQDHGRTIGEANGSVRRVIENVESACSALYGLVKTNEHMEQVAHGIDQYLTWEPLGAFLIITPGNIPMHAWSSFVPYALAAGCTVVVSPSRQDPVAAEYICRVAQEVGFPPGVINLVHGGRNINKEILIQPEIKGVGFIGANKAGWELFELCGKYGKTSSINGNGKNYFVVMPDADLDEAAQGLLRSCFGMAGQRCLGVDNIIVVGDIYDEFKKKFVEVAKGMKIGYGLNKETELGPLSSKAGKDKVLHWIEESLKEGAEMVLDGRNVKVENYPDGFFLGPTILGDVNVDMAMAKVEAFGPVAALIKGDSLEQAIGWINTKTNLGHSASIYTNNGKHARRFKREVNVGNVGINIGVPQPYSFFPLGSRRESFVGTAKSRMASMRMFMDEKTVCERWID